MSNNQFDETMRHIIADEHIPYNEDNWTALQQRLDKPKQNKLFLLLPIYYKAAAAACIAALGCITWYHATKTDTALPVAVQKTSAMHSSPITSNTIPPTSQSIALQQKPSSIKYAKPILAKNELKVSANEETHATVVEENKIAQSAEVTPNSSSEKPKHYTAPLNTPMDAPITSTGSNINLAVNGGYAIIQSGNGLSAGMTIRNRITDKLSFEANIGYIQGSQSIPQGQSKGDFAYDGAGAGPNQHMGVASVDGTTKSYKWQQRNLPYLQLTPGLNLKINKKLSGTLGVDVQKILLDKDILSSLNEDLAATSKKIPSVDPGIMLKGNYGITKRIGCGIAYRKSIANFNDGSNKFINRDYLLFQLQYTIIK